MALALVGAACTSGGGRKAAPQTTSAASSTSTTAGVTSTTLDPTKSAILAAYRAHWDDVIAVSSKFPVNPLDPRLSLHTTGKQLMSEQQALTEVNLKNRYEMGTLDLHPTVTSVNGNSALIMDCDFDHSVEMDGRTSRPVDEPDIGHTLLRFTMTKVNGTWLVSDSTTLKSGKTIDACTPGVL